MESLRIVLASDWYRPRTGGVETSIYNLARTLQKKGHEPIIVTHQYNNHPAREGLDTDDGVIVVRFRVPLREDQDDVTTSLKAAALLHDFLKHNAVDIVHGHSLVSPFAHMAVHVGKALLGIPTLITHHSLLKEEINFRRKILLKIAAMKADVVTAVSTVSAEDAEEILGRSVYVTHNCIPLQEWGGADPIFLEGDPVVLLVSRLLPRKNPLLAVRAFASLVKEAPSARMYVLGSGPMRGEIVELAARLGVDRKLVMVGSVDHDTVKGYMAAGDLLLLPSPKEAFPMAALEAQAYGVPVIGFGHTGVRDIVIDGVNGLLAESEKDFVEKAVKLGADHSLRKAMSREALRISESFDCDAVYEREYSSAYKLALDSCTAEKRYLLYKLFRLLKADPVRPGEWCRERRDRYARVPPKRSGVPYIRRGARRAAIPVIGNEGNNRGYA